MAKILISINPEHVDNIVKGIKKYEYRTRVAKQAINSIIVYSTFPRKEVVAEVKIDAVLSMSPEKLWEETKEYSGITKEYFEQYFMKRDIAYAYKLGEMKIYDKPKSLSDFGIRFAPQSYVYVRI